MKIRSVYRYAIVLSTVSFLSCGKPAAWNDGNISSGGGASHANTYHEFNGFTLQAAMNDRLPLEDSSGISAPPLPLDAVFTVVATLGGTISKVASTTLQWTAKLDTGYVAAGMCADAEGSVYCAATDGSLYCFDATGKRQWKRSIVDSQNVVAFYDVILTNDGLFAATYGGDVVKCSKSGKIIWRRTFAGGIARPPCADANGRLYVPVADAAHITDTVICIDNSGKTLWNMNIPAMTLTAAPVITGSSVVAGGKKFENGNEIPMLIGLDMSGHKQWEVLLDAVPRYISIATDGHISTVGWNAGMGIPLSSVRSFTADGAPLEKLYYRFPVYSPVLHAAENAVFTGSQNSAYGVYLLDKSGSLNMVLSMEDAPDLNLNPAVAPDGTLLFAAKNKPVITRVGMKKSLLPF